MLAVLLSAWFMAQFDFFVVNVAAPSFRADLHAAPAALELIVGGYAFSYAAGMVTGGRLGERFGFRRVFIVGMLGFTLASLLCGISQDPAQLVLARLLQGLTGAVMVPQVLAVITAAFSPEDRPAAIGWYSVAGGLGAVCGQVLGGLLLQEDVFGLGWRVIFLLNVPVGLVGSVLARRILPSLRSERPGGQDPLGAVGVAAALALVLVPLTLGHEQGWPLWTWVCLAASMPVGAGFVTWQRYLHGKGGSPVLDVTLFRLPSYVAGIVSVVAFMAFFASFMFTLTLLLQGSLGLNALNAGLTFAPMGVLFSVSAMFCSRLVARRGLVVSVAGGVMVAVSLVAMLVLVSADGRHTPVGWLLPTLGLMGIGNGLVMPPLIGIALAQVRPDQAGIGAAGLATSQQFAGSAGVGVIGAVFFAAAGSSNDFVRAMEQSVLIDLGLVVLVTVLISRFGRLHRATAPSRDRAVEAAEL
jgi:EmrB/QacA subfamily drug resistance transporter